jgi:hypothetical protein
LSSYSLGIKNRRSIQINIVDVKKIVTVSIIKITDVEWHALAFWVEAQSYKPECRGFESQ